MENEDYIPHCLVIPQAFKSRLPVSPPSLSDQLLKTEYPVVFLQARNDTITSIKPMQLEVLLLSRRLEHQAALEGQILGQQPAAHSYQSLPLHNTFSKHPPQHFP